MLKKFLTSLVSQDWELFGCRSIALTWKVTLPGFNCHQLPDVEGGLWEDQVPPAGGGGDPGQPAALHHARLPLHLHHLLQPWQPGAASPQC